MVTSTKHPQIRLSAVTYEELRRLGEKGESFDDIVRRLIVVFARVQALQDPEEPAAVPGEVKT